MSTYTRSELENSGQCHQKSIRALPLSSMLRVEPGLILIISVASCTYTIRKFSFHKIHLMMNSRNIQPAKILHCAVLPCVYSSLPSHVLVDSFLVLFFASFSFLFLYLWQYFLLLLSLFLPSLMGDVTIFNSLTPLLLVKLNCLKSENRIIS